MLRYVCLRLVQAVPTLLGMTVVGFLLIHLIPGDPARVILGAQATPESIAVLRREFGLDESLLSQYASFLGGAVQLDFGTSIRYRESVSSLMLSRLGPSALLVGYSLLVALMLAVPLGAVAALRRDQPADHAIRVVGMAVFAMPPFWLALLLILVFAVYLGIFPSSGYGDSMVDHLRSLTLPAVTTGLLVAPFFVRSLRASIVETLDSGYVEAARARGLSERRVLTRYVLRNAMLPTLTLVGLSVGSLVSTNVVVESVFGLPGLGSLLVSAVGSRDFPLIQGLIVMIGALVVLMNLVTDLAYALVDARVRL